MMRLAWNGLRHPGGQAAGNVIHTITSTPSAVASAPWTLRARGASWPAARVPDLLWWLAGVGWPHGKTDDGNASGSQRSVGVACSRQEGWARMRLFVAVETGPETAESVALVVAELKRRLATAEPAVRVSWVEPERVHLTLRFIGEVDESKDRAIRACLQRGVPLLPFRVEVGGLSAFPDRGPMRVLWVGLTAGVEQLAVLEKLVSKRLLQAGVAADRSAFHPHVTVGRLRTSTTLRPSQLFQGIEDVTLGSIDVTGYTLFESRPTAHGSEYVPLLRTRLACQAVHRDI